MVPTIGVIHRSSTTARKKALARHEAGHMVVALGLGLTVISASINWRNKNFTTGMTRCLGTYTLDPRWGIVACAGGAGNGDYILSEGDFELAKSAGFSFKDLHRLSKLAKQEIDKASELHRILTQELLNRNRLNRKQIQTLVRWFGKGQSNAT